MKKWINNHIHIVIAAAATLVACIIIGCVFDFYFQFNDDVLMQDILSGAYSGTPSALNNQMLAPLGLVISTLFRIAPGIPWYGLFLLSVQFVCIFLVIMRGVYMARRRILRITAAVVAVFYIFAGLLSHLVMVQYTVTVAFLASTACFLLYTIPPGTDRRTFIRSVTIPVICIILGFQLRPEMMLLMMPYVLVCGVAVYSRHAHAHPGQAVRFLCLAGVIAAGMLISWGADAAAYSHDDWQIYRDEFDARTQLYDYEYVPSYEEHREFYDASDISAAQVELLTIYDYGLDERIDADMMRKVAGYAADIRPETTRERVISTVREYLYRITHFTDGAFAALILFMYVMLTLIVIHRSDETVRRKASIIVFRVFGLMCARSVAWLYIIYGRRQPERITHSLYIIESIVLFAMIITEFTCKMRDRSSFEMITHVVLIVAGLICIPASVIDVSSMIGRQAGVNVYGDAIDAYCASHPEAFYWEDVYSTILDGETFNERIFGGRDPRNVKNYDLIGGWAMNSPLQREKTNLFGIEDIAGDLVTSDDTYLIIANIYDTDWIVDYYSDTGMDVSVETVDTIADYYSVVSIQTSSYGTGTESSP